MGDLDCILRIPPASPSRRDYGIRSPARSLSPVRLDDLSRPQSPWRQAPATSREVDAFRLYESNPPPLVLDRSSYYSGPLPAAPERSSLPSYSGPLPGFSTATTESFEFATWARIYHQHANDSNLEHPEGGSGSSQDSSFREDRAKEDSSTSTFYLAAASPATEFSARAGMHGRVGSVSGELGRSENQKALVARSYKSGEITGLDFGAADAVRQQRWESLNKPDTSPNCDIAEPMVTIPFKWEGESKKSRSRASSTTSKSAPIGASVQDFSFGSSHTKSSVETASVQGSEASETVSLASKPVKAMASKPSTPKKQSPTVHSAVPFKWEDAPGKPKHEESKASTETKTPALQLPPRLASASVKRGSWSTSTPSTTRSRSRSSSNTLRARPTKTQTQSSPDSTSSKHSRRSQPVLKSKPPSPQPTAKPSPPPASPPQPASSPQAASTSQPASSSPQPASSPQDADEPRHTLGPNFLSCPLDNNAKPVASAASKSGPISQLGFPQHDFFSVRSPTSTLQGPGSSISSSQPSSCKSPSVTYSHSGTSAESLEHWSDPDQSGHGHESFESETTITRKRLPSKPPMSPIVHSPRTLTPSDFDKAPVAADEEDPPTRLPYKMPETNTCQDIVVAKPASRRSNSRCFDLPRFRSKSSQGHVETYVPSSSIEHGYRSPTYKATLDLLSPSPSPTPATSKARSVKHGSASPRNFVEGFCNSLKHSLHKISKRNGRKSKTIVQDDLFMKRHPSLGI